MTAFFLVLPVILLDLTDFLFFLNGEKSLSFRLSLIVYQMGRKMPAKRLDIISDPVFFLVSR